MDARIQIIREMGGYRPSQVLRLFEYERDGKRGWATERWLRSQGVDPDAEIRGLADFADGGSFDRDSDHGMRGRRKKGRPQHPAEVLSGQLPLLCPYYGPEAMD